MLTLPLPGPLGGLELVWSPTGLTSARFVDTEKTESNQVFPDAARYTRAVAAWLAGDLRALDDVPVDPPGTPFQRAVWAELRRICAGTTLTYLELAQRMGDPAATRAVARANATNPVALFIPCHRVIGSDGKLVGYAGGLERKRWLLAHEGAPGFLVA